MEAFDRSIASQHSYLGDVDDLEGLTAYLEPNQVYTLPLIPLDGVVLCPGETLPLRLLHASDRISVARALTAPTPTRRLIAVVCCKQYQSHGVLNLDNIGCVAELCKKSIDGFSLLARGRQRFELLLERQMTNINLQEMSIRVLDDAIPTSVPSGAAAGGAFWDSWAYRRYNPSLLAAEAKRLFHAVAPQAKEFQGEPLPLSFWLVNNLPLDAMQRQRLLAANTAIERLRMEINLLKDLSTLYCSSCGVEFASSKDIVSLRDEGNSGMYVNSHAVIHDIITLGTASNLHLSGPPEVEHSWFPGFSWQIAYCSACENHLGWKFAATRPELEPQQFYGIRRESTVSDPRRAGLITMGFSSDEDEEEEDGGEEEESEEESEGEEDHMHREQDE